MGRQKVANYGVEYRTLPQVASEKPVVYGQNRKEWIKFQTAKNLFDGYTMRYNKYCDNCETMDCTKCVSPDITG